jgi:hypothetical protein
VIFGGGRHLFHPVFNKRLSFEKIPDGWKKIAEIQAPHYPWRPTNLVIYEIDKE